MQVPTPAAAPAARPVPVPGTDEAALYVFGYGSLMWSPGFEPDAVHPARVFGWHRRFSRVSTTSWGSPEAPGLCAALHPGGTAWGRVLRLPRERARETLDTLDRRERAYRRRLVRVAARIDGGLVWLAALTYVADPADPTLAPDLGPAEARRYALDGVGTKGAAFDYVLNAVSALSEDGHDATDAHRFLAMISARPWAARG